MVSNTINRIKLIVYRYKSDSVNWKNDFNIVTGDNVVSSQAREILHNDTVDFARKDVFDHFLKRKTVKPFAAKTIINIIMRYRNLVLFAPAFDDKFLVFYRTAFFFICN